MTIQDKVVAVTGAGRGIGRATALQLASRGARLVLGARSEPELVSVIREITTAGGMAVFHVTDVAGDGGVSRLHRHDLRGGFDH